MLTTPNRQDENILYQLMSRRVVINREVAAYLLILLLAIFTRFFMLGERVMSHDESLHTQFSYYLYRDGNFSHTPLMHGPVLFHANALAYFLFGASDFSGRLYTAALGVIMVMFPLLLRRWLGRLGALFASMMILISPLLLFYHRYIRHDTPSILFGMVMLYCILQYLNGAPNVRRRAYWLYIFAAAMILNLGSKETAFIYIVIFSSFLVIYFLVRLAQHRYDLEGKTLLHTVALGILLGGVMTLGMFIIVDIVPAEIIPGRGTPWSQLSDLDRSSWTQWTLLTLLAGIGIPSATALYAFRRRRNLLPWRELATVVLIALLTTGALLFIEELSHFPVPNEPDSAETESGDAPAIEPEPLNWAPMYALWLIALVATPLLIRDARRSFRHHARAPDSKSRPGFWGFLHQFPEVDFIVLMATLILPWLTALFPRLMGGDSAARDAVVQSLPTGIANFFNSLPLLDSFSSSGHFVLSVYAFAPLFILMVVVGITWNWRRWIISAAIFHVIFAFFFTTVFTNIAGLASGMVYSLGYWLEQQGVRRGSQPQYYYLLIILPVYEFLPVIGSVTAMFAGITAFWNRRRKRIVEAEIEVERAIESGPETQSVEQDGFIESTEGTVDAQEAVIIDEAEEPSYIRDRTLRIDAGEGAPNKDYLRRVPFLLLIAWWAILNLVGYSLAGEKMPWLGTHMTMPMILIAAWYFGGVISRIDKAQFLAHGWKVLLVMPMFIICLAQVLGAFVIGDPPFAGLSKDQLERTYTWLLPLFLASGLSYFIYRVKGAITWMHLRRLAAASIFGILSLLTFRSAWLASFINYDLATEFLVYAHAAPAVKWVLDDIKEMSLRMTDGMDLSFAYDDEVPWPYSWYFREFTDAVYVGPNPSVEILKDKAFVVIGSSNRGEFEPILEDRFLRRDHMFMWWPMQEYFDLTPSRLMNVLDFSPDNQQAADIRRGLFDIWWRRDYSRYGDAIGKDFSLANWPVSDHMNVFVRKDFASQIWEYGVGGGEVPSNITEEVNQCAANWQHIPPLLEFDTSAQELLYPLGMAARDGVVYVADESRHEALSFSSDGRLLRTYGGETVFNRPNSVASLPNGDLLVADTWNYRIAQLNQDGSPLLHWGKEHEYGTGVQTEPVHGFWGPRDVAVDSIGRIYVTDSGNKRIRVYILGESEAIHLRDIGSGGSGAGELDEPAGIALHSDGRVFVADSWNRRIAVFDGEGIHIENFPVRGWYNSTFNRPYLALDEARNLLYITDPDGKRILVYEPEGECLGSFGREGSSSGDGQFESIGGIAVDEGGYIYVSDSTAGKALKFPPFNVVAQVEEAIAVE